VDVAQEVDWPALRAAASAVMRLAYAPYSRFPVGAAALVDDGRVVVSCNVENASYGLGLCAECGIVSALHASGGGRLVALSCVDATGSALMPCGRCRQLLWEHGGSDCLVDAPARPLRVADLLPYAFDEADLDRSPARRLSDQSWSGAGAAPDAVPSRLLPYVGHGTVFVHRDVQGGRTVWTGYWERAAGPDEAAGILEEAPTWSDVSAATAWGRARTSRVVVVEPDGSLRWAGDGPPPALDDGAGPAGQGRAGE
jgi:cytidine deaminase